MKKQRTAFITAAVVLGIAAITLNTVVTTMRLHFQKMPVALREPLDEVPSQLGPWLQVSTDQPLDKELEDVLGTSKYIIREYVDTRKVSSSDLEALKKGSTSDDFRRVMGRVATDTPDAVINAAVYYYTGMVDTVAHIPDRCYVADGFEPTTYTTPTWDVGKNDPLRVRFINFEDQTSNQGHVPVNVSYFFQCNGAYECDPLSGVRFRLQNLSEKYGYYAKIELKTTITDSADSERVMADFLRYGLPPIEKCLPDWKALHSQPSATAVASVVRGGPNQ